MDAGSREIIISNVLPELCPRNSRNLNCPGVLAPHSIRHSRESGNPPGNLRGVQNWKPCAGGKIDSRLRGNDVEGEGMPMRGASHENDARVPPPAFYHTPHTHLCAESQRSPLERRSFGECGAN